MPFCTLQALLAVGGGGGCVVVEGGGGGVVENSLNMITLRLPFFYRINLFKLSYQDFSIYI